MPNSHDLTRRQFLATSMAPLVIPAFPRHLSLVPDASGLTVTPLKPVPDWWMTPKRLLQTNLREIDARMDVDAFVVAARDVHANVILFNAGGIVANYPTTLPYHFRNPYMEGDLLGEVLGRLHDLDIRLIARYDFSKINEEVAREHPEWLSAFPDGSPFPAYNGQVPTCVNGWYQQEGMLEILGELLDRYPIDGIFFNMIGYPRSDYSGRKLPACQCASCKRRFRELFGLDLPKTDPEDSEAGRLYFDFTEETTLGQIDRVSRFIKAKREDVAVCTYTEPGVDIIRSESDRPVDPWKYEESVHTRATRAWWPDKQVANAADHFPSLIHRLTSVSPDLTRKRIYQGMVSGTWLDFYCMGPFHEQEDRLAIGEVTGLFHFHAENEEWLLDTVEDPDVGLFVGYFAGDEHRGIVTALSQDHVCYGLTTVNHQDFSSYPALILPLEEVPEEAVLQRLDRYVEAGGRLLLTGGPPLVDLTCLGLQAALPKIERAPGTYIRIRPEDQTRLASPVLDALDLVFLDGDLWLAELDPKAEDLLRFIPPAMFGPPEKCYYTEVSDIPCLYVRHHGAGKVAWIPWQIGSHYHRQGHAGHAALLLRTLDRLLEAPRRVSVDASPMVEMTHRLDREGRFEWVSLYNHSGQMDRVQGAPVPLYDLAVRIQPRMPPRRVRLLKSKQEIGFTPDPDGSIRIVVPRLDEFEVVVVRY